MSRAEIIAGVIVGSTSVTVACSAANSTSIVVYLGYLQLGTGAITNNQATVALSQPLAAGDIIQAYVAVLGNQAGVPVRVPISTVVVTGWKSATEVDLIYEGETVTMTVEQFYHTFHSMPADIHDLAAIRPILRAEAEPPAPTPIRFDVILTKSSGSTLVEVANVTGTNGATLVKWGALAYSSSINQTFSATTTVQITVKGADDDDLLAASRTITVDVLAGSGGGSPTPAPTPELSFGAYAVLTDSSDGINYVNTYNLTGQQTARSFRIATSNASGTVEYSINGGSWGSSPYFIVTRDTGQAGAHTVITQMQVRTSTGQNFSFPSSYYFVS